MTLQLQLQRHGDVEFGCQTTRHARRTMSTTPPRRASCRRPTRPLAARWLSRDPIEEDGWRLFNSRRGWRVPSYHANLYCFSDNDSIARVDVLGLEGIDPGGDWTPVMDPDPARTPCTLAYNFDDDESWYEMFAQPVSTKWISKMNEVRKDIHERMKHCCCIQKIFFTTHSGSPGVIILGMDAQVSGDVLVKMYAAVDEAHRRSAQRSHQREREFLQFVQKYMCKGGRVTFVQCDVEQGPQGKALRKWLEGIFGSDVDVTLFAGDVRWFYGSPRCKTKVSE